MARKSPVNNCSTNTIPKRDPKFQKYERFKGEGKSTRLDVTSRLNGLICLIRKIKHMLIITIN